jgi:hypothetical protein
VTDAINVMEAEATACLRNPNSCKFTPFDVSDFHLPLPKPGSNDDKSNFANVGEVIANRDPLAILLRDQPGHSRTGFVMGLGAAENQTLPGPGKDRFRDSLAVADRASFQQGVDFSLDKNNNPDLAARGAAIVKSDHAVADARSQLPLSVAWLGFDIATGIFGSASEGALGNTAEGPGSQKIRDKLSIEGQQGFKAAVTFHLSRVNK